MSKALHGHSLHWSVAVSHMVQGPCLSLPPLLPPSDGSRDLPDADLDALAEAVLAGLSEPLGTADDRDAARLSFERARMDPAA